MVSKNEVEKLRGALSGTLLQVDDVGYDASITIDNGRVRRKPAIVVRPAGTQDVRLALSFAREHVLTFTVKGGGHSGTGYCLNSGGLVLDMSSMKRKVVDLSAQTVRAETGNTWMDLYLHLQNLGSPLIPIGGLCPTVGIPGFILGGGFSFLSRSYGLGLDNLLSLTLVTADGEVRHVSAKDEPELFWACRGGGGGNFGIVTEMELRLHAPRFRQMLMGRILYPLERIEQVLAAYNDWADALPPEMAAYGYVGSTPSPADPSITQQAVGLTVCYNGPYSKGMELLAPMLKFPAISVALNNVTLPDFEVMGGRSTQVANRQAYIRSGMLPPRGFNPEVASIFEKYMTAPPSPYSFVIWDHVGGKISEVSATETAYWHRDARFVFEVKAIWEKDSQMAKNVDWAYRFGEELAPHFQGAYVNYIDPLLSNWSYKYYGENYARLCELKKRYDPDNFFSFQQSIGSKFEPSKGEPLDLTPLNRTVAPPSERPAQPEAQRLALTGR